MQQSTITIMNAPIAIWEKPPHSMHLNSIYIIAIQFPASEYIVC